MLKKLLLIVPLALLLVCCSNPNADPFKAYRAYSSAKLFASGEHALYQNHYDDAVKYFEAMGAIYPFGPYAQQAQLDLIYAYHLSDDDASAIAAADRYIHLYPRSKHVDYAYYMRGLIGFTVGLSWLQRFANIDPAPRDISTLQQSFVSFAQLSHYFPHSKYTPNAELRMRYIRNLMARRELIVADFYMQHKAYVAAANRAAYVVQHFQGSPQVVNALEIMVKAYRGLHLDQMANQTYKIMAANYSHTKQFAAVNK